eukprot:jgi/Ulvmu1/11510/UM077_0059.1
MFSSTVSNSVPSSKRGPACLDSYIGRSLVFYAQYHEHPVNIAIHVVFVPTIFLATLILLAYIPSLRDYKEGLAPEGIPAWLDRSWDISIGNAIVALYVALYSVWDPVAGSLWAAITAIPLLIAANYVQAEVPKAWAWALGLQVLSWYMQVHPGHLIYEKRRPALTDSLIQAFLTGPLFVWLDVLFVLGYRPALKTAVKDEVRKLKAEQGMPDNSQQQGRMKAS